MSATSLGRCFDVNRVTRLSPPLSRSNSLFLEFGTGDRARSPALAGFPFDCDELAAPILSARQRMAETILGL
jgi:hypothetical protein